MASRDRFHSMDRNLRASRFATRPIVSISSIEIGLDFRRTVRHTSAVVYDRRSPRTPE